METSIMHLEMLHYRHHIQIEYSPDSQAKVWQEGK